MTLDQLEVFQAIVFTGSFRGASERLNRAQSAVSYAIQNLEEDLGCELFDRNAYRAQLTPQGETIYQKAQSLLQE